MQVVDPRTSVSRPFGFSWFCVLGFDVLIEHQFLIRNDACVHVLRQYAKDTVFMIDVFVHYNGIDRE